MERSKQVNAKRIQESKARGDFSRGSGKAYLSETFGQKPESSKGLGYRLF